MLSALHCFDGRASCLYIFFQKTTTQPTPYVNRVGSAPIFMPQPIPQTNAALNQTQTYVRNPAIDSTNTR
jgi:hypothetical protein